jgi:hypothetical protein
LRGLGKELRGLGKELRGLGQEAGLWQETGLWRERGCGENGAVARDGLVAREDGRVLFGNRFGEEAGSHRHRDCRANGFETGTAVCGEGAAGDLLSARSGSRPVYGGASESAGAMRHSGRRDWCGRTGGGYAAVESAWL